MGGSVMLHTGGLLLLCAHNCTQRYTKSVHTFIFPFIDTPDTITE